MALFLFCFRVLVGLEAVCAYACMCVRPVKESQPECQDFSLTVDERKLEVHISRHDCTRLQIHCMGTTRPGDATACLCA